MAKEHNRIEQCENSVTSTGIQATRGNDLRIFKTHFKYDLRKFYFTNRVGDAWNSLPNWIVMANSTNTFKHRLDTCWQIQIIYSFHKQKHKHATMGIGLRPLCPHLTL